MLSDMSIGVSLSVQSCLIIDALYKSHLQSRLSPQTFGTKMPYDPPNLLCSKCPPFPSQLLQPEDQIDQYATNERNAQEGRTPLVVIIDSPPLSQLEDPVGVHASAVGDCQEGREGEASGGEQANDVVGRYEVE